MDSLLSLFEFNPGIYVKELVNWLTVNFQGFFDALTVIINWIVFNIQALLASIPGFVHSLIFLLGWRLKTSDQA